MIFDFRLKPPYKSMLDQNVYNERPVDPDPVTVNGLLIDMPEQRSFEEHSMEAFFEEMDEAGIDMAVVTGRKAPAPFYGVDNRDIYELVAQHPDRFVGVGAVDPHDPGAIDEIDEIADNGLVGIMTNSMWYDPPLYDDSPEMMRLYEKCIERDLLISTTGSVFMGPDYHYANPVHIQRVCLEYPELTVVMGHGSWPWDNLLAGVAFQCPNLYIMGDIYLNIPNVPGADSFVEAANSYLSHRLLFGSAYPVRGMLESVRWGESLPFRSDEVRERVMGLNTARLLGIDPDKARRLPAPSWAGSQKS